MAVEWYSKLFLGTSSMSHRLKKELSVWAQYFAIAFIAEVAGFIGWLKGMNSGGDMFDLSSAFWVHELSRMYVWLPAFVLLSAFRFGVFHVAHRNKPQLG